MEIGNGQRKTYHAQARSTRDNQQRTCTESHIENFPAQVNEFIRGTRGRLGGPCLLQGDEGELGFHDGDLWASCDLNLIHLEGQPTHLEGDV